MSVPERTAFGEPLLDAAQLAKALGMSRRWVYAQVEENGLPAYKLGRSLAFELAAVRAWLEQRRVGDWPKSVGAVDTSSVVRQTQELSEHSTV